MRQLQRTTPLLIETANVVLDSTSAAAHANVTPGPYVMLAASDSGKPRRTRWLGGTRLKT